MNSNESDTAIIIPAHNEEKGITRTLSSLLLCTPSRVIVVIADNCTDGTAEIARKAGARVLERTDLLNRGKPYALEFALDILLKENFHRFVFIDADTVVDKNFLQVIDEKMKSGVKALQVRYGLLTGSGSLRLRLGNIAFSAFNLLRPTGRSYWGLSAGILGNGFVLDRSVLEKVPFRTDSPVEDLAYHLQLVKAGIRVEFTDETAVWADAPITSAGNVTQRSRWEGGRLRTAKEEVPALIRGILAGNRGLMEPLLDLLLPPLAYYVLLLVILFLLPLRVGKIYAFTVLILILVHVTTTLILMKASFRDWISLAFAPFYLIWKLSFIPSLYRAVKKKITWTRTER